MKKVLIYVLGMVLLSFFIPILFTEQFVATKADVAVNELVDLEETANATETKEDSEIVSENDERVKGNESETNSYLIKVFFTDANEVREIELEEYLYGVVSAEMPADFEMEALKAQTVVARTFTLYRVQNNSDKHGEAVICTDSNCCQAWISKEDRFKKWPEDDRDEYWNKIVEAVNCTAGQVITYNGKVINAFFHANSGGKTELPANVWGGGDYPYLQAIETSGEEGYSQYESEAMFTKEELIDRLKENYSNIEFELDDIEIIERSDSGRVKTIRFGNNELSGVETRKLLGLKSTNFEISVEEEQIKFIVHGYGHGIGMSQTGADSLAKQGMNYVDIIKHFYAGVEVVPELAIRSH